jgi:hypothetical protein
MVGRGPARAAFPMIGHYRRGLAVIGFEEIHSALYILDPLRVNQKISDCGRYTALWKRGGTA